MKRAERSFFTLRTSSRFPRASNSSPIRTTPPQLQHCLAVTDRGEHRTDGHMSLIFVFNKRQLGQNYGMQKKGESSAICNLSPFTGIMRQKQINIRGFDTVLYADVTTNKTLSWLVFRHSSPFTCDQCFFVKEYFPVRIFDF